MKFYDMKWFFLEYNREAMCFVVLLSLFGNFNIYEFFNTNYFIFLM